MMIQPSLLEAAR